jgi:glutathione S-transferase
MLQYTALVTLFVVVFYFFLATRVSAARRKFGVKLPATSGHPDFERVQRVHLNTLEWMPIFLPLLWLSAFYFSDGVSALLGLVWIGGRISYLVGYSEAVEKRLTGFFIQSAACVLLLVLAAVGIVRQLG